MKNITKISYRPEIDGLRAIAILSVLFYHANFELFGFRFTGGYLGVDIFFVISGYLISKIIFKEISVNGKFNYLYFLERRARRLLPASLFMILISFIPAYFLLLPQFFENFSLSAISSIFFSSNIYFHYSGLLYGAESSLLKPLLHTWSLSVEEQFYIFFSIFILFFFNFLKKFLNIIFIVIFLISISFANYASDHHISFNFYMIFSRAWEFLIGILIAYNEKKLKNVFTNSAINNLIIFLSLFIILSSFFYFNGGIGGGTSHPSFFTLPIILATGAVIILFDDKFKYQFLLNNKFAVFFGKISYSLYLWHFPVFSFYRISKNNFDDNISDIGFPLILIVILISYFSFHFIEQPLRDKNKINLGIFFKIVSTKLIFASFISLLIIYNKGYDERLPENLRLRIVDDRIIYLSESISCHKKFRNKDQFCQFNKKQSKKIFILGDSQLETFVYSFKRLKDLQEYEITQMTRPGCYLGRTNDYRAICTSEHHDKRLDLIKKNPGSIIIIGGSLSHYLNINAFDQVYFTKTIEELIRNKHKIIFIHPLPNFKVNVRQKIANSFMLNKELNKNMFPIVNIKKQVYLENISKADKILTSYKHENISYLHPKKIFCDKYIKDKCVANNNSDLFFVDSNHLSNEGNKLINLELLNIINNINY